MERHYKYYVYSWNELIYIGHTNDPTATFEDHERNSWWWDQALDIQLFRCGGRKEGARQVDRDVCKYHPRYNNKNVTPWSR